LTDEPKTMPQLMEEAGVEATFYNHLRKLIATNYVEKIEKGYRLVS